MFGRQFLRSFAVSNIRKANSIYKNLHKHTIQVSKLHPFDVAPRVPVRTFIEDIVQFSGKYFGKPKDVQPNF